MISHIYKDIILFLDLGGSGLSGWLNGHPCISDDALTIPVVMLPKPESEYLLTKYDAGLIQALSIGRVGM